MMTPDQARQTPCPFARTFAQKVGPNCDADACIMWRWVPLMPDDPRFMSAINREMACLAQDDGKGKPSAGYHKQAVANVMRNPEGYGVPAKREVGYCGLAGKPEA